MVHKQPKPNTQYTSQIGDEGIKIMNLLLIFASAAECVLYEAYNISTNSEKGCSTHNKVMNKIRQFIIF